MGRHILKFRMKIYEEAGIPCYYPYRVEYFYKFMCSLSKRNRDGCRTNSDRAAYDNSLSNNNAYKYTPANPNLNPNAQFFRHNPVPEDQPTIQAGIDAARDGDIVLVHPASTLKIWSSPKSQLRWPLISSPPATNNSSPIRLSTEISYQ